MKGHACLQPLRSQCRAFGIQQEDTEQEDAMQEDKPDEPQQHEPP